MRNPIMRFFKYDHLKAQQRIISSACALLASDMDQLLPENAEKSAGMRKLLEAKDCFVRASLPPEEEDGQAQGTAIPDRS